MGNYHHNSLLTGLPISTFGPYALHTRLESLLKPQVLQQLRDTPKTQTHKALSDLGSIAFLTSPPSIFLSRSFHSSSLLLLKSTGSSAASGPLTSCALCLKSLCLPLITCRLVLLAKVYTWQWAMPT